MGRKQAWTANNAAHKIINFYNFAIFSDSYYNMFYVAKTIPLHSIWPGQAKRLDMPIWEI